MIIKSLTVAPDLTSLVLELIELNQPLGLSSLICISMPWLGIVLRSSLGPLRCVILVDWSVEMSYQGYIRTFINLWQGTRRWVGRLWGRKQHKMRLKFVVVCKKVKIKCVGMIRWVVWCILEVSSLRLMGKDGWFVLEPIDFIFSVKFLWYTDLCRSALKKLSFPSRSINIQIPHLIINAACSLEPWPWALISHVASTWHCPHYWSYICLPELGMLSVAESSPPPTMVTIWLPWFRWFRLFWDHRKRRRRQAMSFFTNILDQTDLRPMARSQSQLGQHSSMFFSLCYGDRFVFTI